jgi:sn-glycerol 3-phosphate transport system substrate-binding protein
MVALVAIGGVVAAGCRSHESLANAGYPKRPVPTTAPPAATTTPPATAAPSSSTPPASSAPDGSAPSGSTPATEPATTQPGETTTEAPTTTAAPTTTVPPPTTQPALLDSLPKCDVHALDNVTSPVSITFWHGLSNANGDELQKVTDAYNASQSKVRVNLQFQGGYAETIDKYLQSDQSNRPDMVQLPEYMVQQMIDTKSIVPAQACAESADYDTSDFIPGGLRAYATQGVQWSMPFNISVPVLYFLRPTFVKAGLDPDNPPDTLEELFEQGKQIVASGAAKYSIALDSDFDGGGGWYIEQWLAKGGNYYADNENGRLAPATKVLYDEAPGVELITYLQKLITEGGAVYVGDNASGTDALLKLADATAPAAMTIATSAAIGPVFAALGGGLIPGVTQADVGVGFMPGPNGGLGGLVGGNSLYIVDHGDAAKAAATWDFLTYLDSPAVQSEIAAVTGYIPVRSKALDVDPIKTTYTTDPRFKIAYDQLLGSADAPTSLGPVIGPLEQVRKVTAAAVATVLTGGDPQAALSAAAQQADDLIANYALTNG